jgi:hypothetical protein
MIRVSNHDEKESGVKVRHGLALGLPCLAMMAGDAQLEGFGEVKVSSPLARALCFKFHLKLHKQCKLQAINATGRLTRMSKCLIAAPSQGRQSDTLTMVCITVKS